MSSTAGDGVAGTAWPTGNTRRRLAGGAVVAASVVKSVVNSVVNSVVAASVVNSVVNVKSMVNSVVNSVVDSVGATVVVPTATTRLTLGGRAPEVVEADAAGAERIASASLKPRGGRESGHVERVSLV